MKNLILVRDLKQGHKLVQAMVRLPKETREQAQKLAQSSSGNGVRVTESDVYRTAILVFLSANSTDSRD